MKPLRLLFTISAAVVLTAGCTKETADFIPSSTRSEGDSTGMIPDLGIITRLVEPANCYIVTHDGIYTFLPRLVDGTMLQNVADAKLLWEVKAKDSYAQDCGPASEAQTIGWASDTMADATLAYSPLITDVRCYDGLISFRASEEKGNAAIAALDEYGNIVWSWHIWLTDRPQDVTDANGKVFIDRDLGAPAAGNGPQAYGLLYQWGRKDPLYGGNANETGLAFSGADDHTYIGFGYGWDVAYIGMWDTGSSLRYAVREPMSMICREQAYIGNADWMPVGDSSLWGAEKTNYDPCPSGYKVPESGSWGKRWEAVAPEEAAEGSACSGVSESVAPNVQPGYPACGFRNGLESGKLQGVGRVMLRWTSTADEAGAKVFDAYKDYGVSDYGSSFRVNALAVRCIKEKIYSAKEEQSSMQAD